MLELEKPAEQREAMLARRRERDRARSSQERVDTRQAQRDTSRAAQQLRREAAQQLRRESETLEARQARLHQDYFNLNFRNSFQQPAIEALINRLFNSM